MNGVLIRKLSSVGLALCFVVVGVGAVLPCDARHHPKVTATTQVWRVVDRGIGETHYAQSIEVGWFAVGGFTTGKGTVTYTPTQTPESSHIEQR